MEQQNTFKKSTVTLSGTVETINRSGISKAGQAYHSLMLKTKDLIYECLSFKDVAEKAIDRIIVGQSIGIRGYYKDEFSKGNKVITLTYISINNEKDSTPIKHQTRQDKEEFKETIEYMESQGLVRTYYKGHDNNMHIKWAREDDCISHNGVWKQHIEFVMDILGVEEVKKRLYANNITTRNIQGYKELLSSMVDEASLKVLQKQDTESYEFDYGSI